MSHLPKTLQSGSALAYRTHHRLQTMTSEALHRLAPNILLSIISHSSPYSQLPKEWRKELQKRERRALRNQEGSKRSRPAAFPDIFWTHVVSIVWDVPSSSLSIRTQITPVWGLSQWFIPHSSDTLHFKYPWYNLHTLHCDEWLLRLTTALFFAPPDPSTDFHPSTGHLLSEDAGNRTTHKSAITQEPR